jgi:hypothetical protein
MASEEVLKAFLDYKKSKVDSISKIEGKRLEDLGNARETIFKYALPVSIIDAVAGGIGALLVTIWILLPTALFIILIYFLAYNLDLQKYRERMEIMNYTEQTLNEIREQEIELIGRA